MTGYAYWENMFNGDATRIKKALYGSFLVRDYAGPATALTNYSPFDPVTGNLSPTLLTTDGWYDVGLLDENGVQFTPKYTTVDTMAWQSRMAQRTDVTLDQEECKVTAIQSTPLLDALTYQKPLAGLAAIGTAGYQITKSTVPVLVQRQILAIGVDGADGTAEYFGTLYTRAQMVKPENYDYQAKTEVQSGLTFDSYPDPYSGFAVRRFREGPAWRAAGGTTAFAQGAAAVAATVSGLKATLSFAPPITANGPFTYQVTQTVGGTTTAVNPSTVSVLSSSAAQVVAQVTGLTPSTGYTFGVLATGVNGSQSAPIASNAVTSTAS